MSVMDFTFLHNRQLAIGYNVNDQDAACYDLLASGAIFTHCHRQGSCRNLVEPAACRYRMRQQFLGNRYSIPHAACILTLPHQTCRCIVKTKIKIWKQKVYKF